MKASILFLTTWLVCAGQTPSGDVRPQSPSSVRVPLGKESKVTQRDVEIVADDQIRLAGTETVAGIVRAVVIPVHGSFVQTRDGDLDGSQHWMFPQGTPRRGLFRDIAQALAPLGVATLRYDKRASGKSGGTYPDTDMERLAADLLSVVGYAKQHHPGAHIGLIGQSEGALTVLRAVQRGARPDFLVLQGPSLEPLEVFLDHQRSRAAAPFLQMPDGELARKYPYLAAFYESMYRGDMLERIRNTDDDHYTLRRGPWSAVTSLAKYRQYRWNGLQMLKEVACPVAVIFGEEDANVRPEAGRRILREQAASGAYSNVRVFFLAGLEHSFREVAPGDDFVSVMGKPLAPQYIDVLKEFVAAQLK
jgi:alpha-beta hydrolase superfamily lysophospholipase